MGLRLLTVIVPPNGVMVTVYSKGPRGYSSGLARVGIKVRSRLRSFRLHLDGDLGLNLPQIEFELETELGMGL